MTAEFVVRGTEPIVEVACINKGVSESSGEELTNTGL